MTGQEGRPQTMLELIREVANELLEIPAFEEFKEEPLKEEVAFRVIEEGRDRAEKLKELVKLCSVAVKMQLKPKRELKKVALLVLQAGLHCADGALNYEILLFLNERLGQAEIAKFLAGISDWKIVVSNSSSCGYEVVDQATIDLIEKINEVLNGIKELLEMPGGERALQLVRKIINPPRISGIEGLLHGVSVVGTGLGYSIFII